MSSVGRKPDEICPGRMPPKQETRTVKAPPHSPPRLFLLVAILGLAHGTPGQDLKGTQYQGKRFQMKYDPNTGKVIKRYTPVAPPRAPTKTVVPRTPRPPMPTPKPPPKVWTPFTPGYNQPFPMPGLKKPGGPPAPQPAQPTKATTGQDAPTPTAVTPAPAAAPAGPQWLAGEEATPEATAKPAATGPAWEGDAPAAALPTGTGATTPAGPTWTDAAPPPTSPTGKPTATATLGTPTGPAWSQPTPPHGDAAPIAAEEAPGALTREELVKQTCDELAALAPTLAGADATLCHEVMEAKGCFRNVLALGASPPQADAPGTPSPTPEPQSPLAKAAEAATKALEIDAEAAALYEKLGIEPGPSWGHRLLNDMSRALNGRNAADEAHVAGIEDIADGLGGIEPQKQPEIPSLSYTGPVQGDPRAPNLQAGPDPEEDFPEVAEKATGAPGGVHAMALIQGKKPHQTLTHTVQPDGRGMLSPTTMAEFFGTAPPKMWNGKGTPKHGMMNDRGQLWSEDYQDWVSEDLWVMEEKIRRKFRPEQVERKKWDGEGEPKHGMVDDRGLVWNADTGQWQSEGLFQIEQKMREDQKQKQRAGREARNMAWREYWRENADMPLDAPIYQADMALKSTKMKWDLLDRLHKKMSTPGSGFDMSMVQYDLLEQRMENAIQKGAQPEHMLGLYNGFIQHHMIDQGHAAAADAQVDEIEAQFWLDRSKDALGVVSGVIGPAGLLAETAAYAFNGYRDGDVKAGLWEAFEMNVPTNTIKFFKDYLGGKEGVSSWDVFWAVGGDLLIGYGAYGNYKNLKSGTMFGEQITGIGSKNMLDDFIDDFFEGADSIARGELDFLKARSAGLDKVNRFRGELAEAMSDAKKLDPNLKLSDIAIDDIDKFPKLRDSMLEVFKDKHAMQMLNRGGAGTTAKALQHTEFIKGFNTIMDAVTAKSDRIMEAGIAAHYADVLTKKGVKFKDLQVETFKPTNKPGFEKKTASYDRDVSANVKYWDDGAKKWVPIEVPEKVVAENLSKGFYDACGKPPLEKFDPHGVTKILWPDEADPAVLFMRVNDQAPTWKLSADAYGHNQFQLDSALKFKDELFLDNLDFGRTYAHKSLEWMEKGHKLLAEASAAEAAGNAARASFLRGYAGAMVEEGFRQGPKQWRNQVKPGVAAVQKAARELGMRNIPKGPAPQLEAAMDILSDVGSVRGGRIVTPEIAECNLRMIGFKGADDVMEKAASYLNAMQDYVAHHPKLKSKLAGKGYAQRHKAGKVPVAR